MTYEELAERYEVPLCQGGCAVKGHTKGFVAGGAVHWTPRRLNRLGLYRFLLLVAELHVSGPGRPAAQTSEGRAWLRITWLRDIHIWAQNTAFHDLQIRFPRSYSATRRSEIRHLMSGYRWPRPPTWERVRRWAKP